MMTLSAQSRDNLMTVAEVGAYLFLVGCGAIAVLLEWMSLATATRLSVCLLVGLLLLA